MDNNTREKDTRNMSLQCFKFQGVWKMVGPDMSDWLREKL